MMRLAAAAFMAMAALAQEKVDPAAWGSNHAGRPVPEFVHGDECLFCHRNDIGPGWQKNSHGVAIRQREDAPELVAKLRPPEDVEFLMGSRNHVRYLKKDGYGKFAIWSNGKWLSGHFNDRCAGCHTTAVDPKTRAFAAFGLDCYTCHGVVDLERVTPDSVHAWIRGTPIAYKGQNFTNIALFALSLVSVVYLVADGRPGVLMVQGGPGTGKTAVGLHRVTWLLDNSGWQAQDVLDATEQFAGERIAENMSEKPRGESMDNLLNRPFNALSDADKKALQHEVKRLAAMLRTPSAWSAGGGPLPPR